MLTDAEKGRLFMALLDYAEFGVVPDFDGALKMAFLFIRGSIDRSHAKWEDIRRQRSEAGRKGGLSKAKRSQAEPSKTGKAKHPVPVPVPVPVPDPVPVSGRDIEADKPPKRKRFSPPSVEEVEQYCRESGYTVDAQRFVDFYASKGWVVGKTPMKDWRAAVRSWTSRDQAERKTTKDIPSDEDYLKGWD